MAGTEDARLTPPTAGDAEALARAGRPAGGAEPGATAAGPESAEGAGSEAAGDALLAALRRVAVEADLVPERVFQAARLTITFRDPDRELAQLVAVSMAESADTAPAGDTSQLRAEGARKSCAPRSGGSFEHGPLMLSFAGAGVHIDLEVTRRDRVVDIAGQLIGAAESGRTIEDADGRRDVELDALGRFLVEGLRGGPIRLRCRSVDGGTVTTAWNPV